jgi:hypothetical protein
MSYYAQDNRKENVMCNNRDYFRKTMIFENEEQIERFIALYGDLLSQGKASYMKDSKYFNGGYMNFYKGYEVVIFVTSENWKVIKDSGLFKKHELSRRGNPVLKYVG